MPWSWKGRAIRLLPYRPYVLYRTSVPVQGCTLPLPMWHSLVKKHSISFHSYITASEMCNGTDHQVSYHPARWFIVSPVLYAGGRLSQWESCCCRLHWLKSAVLFSYFRGQRAWTQFAAESSNMVCTALFRFLVFYVLINIAERGRVADNTNCRVWKKQSKSNLRYYSGISMERMQKTKEPDSKC